jgi:hypothetical protein
MAVNLGLQDVVIAVKKFERATSGGDGVLIILMGSNRLEFLTFFTLSS